MNSLPPEWLNELKSAYPARSGGLGWQDMRLMLSIRSALLTHTWEQILDAIKAYKAYCQQSGKEGSEFVQKPKAWFDQGGYTEVWEYRAPVNPEDAERTRRRAARDARATEAGLKFGLDRDPRESIEAFETRIRLAEASPTRPLSAESQHREFRRRLAALTEGLKA